jgi:hypothetical protein
MSETIGALRARHVLVSERIASLDTVPAGPGNSFGRTDDTLPAGLKDSARELWEAKLVQIHTATVIDGEELYPVDQDGRCTECQLDVQALRRMQHQAPGHRL